MSLTKLITSTARSFGRYSVSGLLALVLAAGCGGAENSPTDSASSCSRDLDCKGERICVENQCVDPNSSNNGNSNYNDDSQSNNYNDGGSTNSNNNNNSSNGCNNNCQELGQKVCSENSWKECGNYDNDSCLEWSSLTNCDSNQYCENGSCLNQDTSGSCNNQCDSEGQLICDQNSWKECGNYDNDSCLEWSSLTNCGSNKYCENGVCLDQDTSNSCTNGCNTEGQLICDQNSWKECGNYDNDSCLEWSSLTNCESNQSCENGSCIDNITPLTGKIAFESDRDGYFEIYVMNADGSNQRRLTNNSENNEHPSWSPDGRKIVFDSDRTYNKDIYVMNEDGSNQVNLTNSDDTWDLDPVWSPNGNKIAFSARSVSDTGIYVMNTNGSNLQQLTSSGDINPSWSPDGTKIAFASDRDNILAIYVMDSDGTNVIKITNDDSVWANHPSWSPNGNKIAFESSRTNNINGAYDVHIMNADGSNQTILTLGYSPAWSPDGTRIVFQSYRDNDNDGELYIINTDGSNLLQTTHNSNEDDEPSWSP